MRSNCLTLYTCMYAYHFTEVRQGYLVKDRSCLRFPPTLQNKPTLAKKKKKGNSSHIGWHIEYPDFSWFSQLHQACQDARVLGWYIDYPDIFRGFPQFLQVCQDARFLGWHIDYSNIFRCFPQFLQTNTTRMRKFSADTLISLTFFVVFLSSSRRMRWCEICGSQWGTAEDSDPLGCASAVQDEGNAFLRNARKHQPD